MKKLVLDDVHFRLGVREVSGIIHAEQGIPMFYSEEEGIIASLPFFVSADQYECPITVYMRPNSNEIVEHLGQYDRLIDELQDDEEDIIGGFNILQADLSEQKIRLIPRAITVMGLMGVAVLFMIIGLILTLSGILASWVPVAVLTVPFVILSWLAYNYISVLNHNILYDAEGNWINFATGETSLTVEYLIEPTEKVC